MAKKQHNITDEVCINRIMQFNDNSFCPDLIRNLIKNSGNISLGLDFKIQNSFKKIHPDQIIKNQLIKTTRNFDRRLIFE